MIEGDMLPEELHEEVPEETDVLTVISYLENVTIIP